MLKFLNKTSSYFNQENSQIHLKLSNCLAKVLIPYFISIGGFGEVKLCEKKGTGELRAVKFMRKDQMTPKSKMWF